MKSKEKLKSVYVYKHTKDWDNETKEKYLSNVEEDFCIWYNGYLSAIRYLSDEVLPILEFSEHKITTSGGVFQQSVSKLIKELKGHPY